MTCRDRLGWPVELIKNRPITNFIRLLLHTSLWQTWKRRKEGENVHFECPANIYCKSKD